MMKKTVKLFTMALAASMSLSFAASTANAASNDAPANAAHTTVTYDDNGGYFVETLEDSTVPTICASIYTANTYSAATTKAKTKTVTYYNEKNQFCWSYLLTATFTVKPGVSATYKSSKASLDNTNSWTVVSESHSGSGPKATGTINMKKNGYAISRTVTIRCDKNGNFS